MTRIEMIYKIAQFNNREIDGFTLLHQKIIEELGEFMQAIMKYDKDSTIEELADVIIVINQYIKTLEEKDLEKLDKMIEFKLERTIKRLKLDKED